MKLNLKFSLLLLNIFLFNLLFGAEYTIEELNELKKQNAISIEDYQILKSELLGENSKREGLYTLKINGKKVSNIYSCLEENEKIYLNLNQFLEVIGLKNYTEDKNKMKILLGDSLKEVELNFSTKKIYVQGKLYDSAKEEWFVKKDGKTFLIKEVFEHLFFSFMSIEKNALEISAYLSFTPPSAIMELLDITKNNLTQKEDETEIIYKGKRELFDIGYARIKLNQNFIRTENSKKFDRDWTGDLEYQGPLLYGNFTANYDIRENELNTIKLDYSNIWKKHTFEIENRNVDSSREWGFRFYKDEGFYNFGEKIIIKEKVPIGSKVELLYMNTPIAIADEENGSVIFDSDMIKTDRTYDLKIYTADGRILLKTIRTTEDYNRQKKHGIKYDFSAEERKSEGGKYEILGNVYYGLTDSFTVGAGLTRSIINTESDGSKYENSGNLELIYGEVYNGISYTLKARGEKSFDTFKESENKFLKDKYKYDTLGELSYDKYKVILTHESFGKYYDEKKTNGIEFQYDLTNNFRVNYDYKITDNYYDKRKKEGRIGFDADWKYKNILFNAETKFDLNDNDNNEYGISAYYGGWQHLTARLENRWTNSGKDYETVLSLYNNNFKGLFDVSTEFKYSKEKKECITFKLSIDIDDWFTFDSLADKAGRREISVGIDKVIDLKNPKVKIDNNIDVSRVNVTTFVDDNNNNVLDKNEAVINGVEVEIGQQKVITDKNGRGTFYGISNGMLYDLKPTIKKPSYTLGNNKIKVLSTYSSTVEAYIPIKPMINLTGYVDLAKELQLSEEEREFFYSDILIEIKDKNGKSLELASPDDTGYFDVSGLFPDEYFIEVSYLGDKYKIPKLKSDLKLSYKKNDNNIEEFEYKIALNVTNNKIKLLSKL